MNKTEKIICIILGAALVLWFWKQTTQKPDNSDAAPGATAKTSSQAAQPAAQPPKAANGLPQQAKAATVSKKQPPADAKFITLSNEVEKVTVSSSGAVVCDVTFFEYDATLEEDSPHVTIAFTNTPLLAVSGVPGLDDDAGYEVESATSASVIFTNSLLKRTITLKENYRISVTDEFAQPAQVRNSILVSAMMPDDTTTPSFSIDSKAAGEKGAVTHHDDDDSPLKPYLSGLAVGCNCSQARAPADSFPKISINGSQDWIALKNRYFVSAMCSSSESNDGFSVQFIPVPATISGTGPRTGGSASLEYSALPKERTVELYIGPKKQDALWDANLRDVMELGWFRWIGYPMVWILNVCYDVIPNYGVAIILLTILVRVLFWPLTHKSTVSMRRMSEIQPKVKEVQEKFKDNPQRMQQEIWAIYRENKVNPLSSCLPMLIQIPVFIALYRVLQNSVELRHAGFLWILDLSEPEALFANSWFPWFGGLNILPIFMAVTMYLQSKLTPSAGDQKQQRMMQVMMPVMMLVMFYRFASALSLYWTMSQVFSIAQMWWIRKHYTPAGKPDAAPAEEETHVTRQMRRHAN